MMAFALRAMKTTLTKITRLSVLEDDEIQVKSLICVWLILLEDSD